MDECDKGIEGVINIEVWWTDRQTQVIRDVVCIEEDDTRLVVRCLGDKRFVIYVNHIDGYMCN